MNLGLVLAPTIGGVLFNDYLSLSFFINGLADISSTLMLLIFIKNVKITDRDHKSMNEYEKGETGSIFKVFSERKLFFLLFVISGIAALIYNQFNFLMPLHMEEAFRGSGAFKFGILTSINAVVVVIGTPILTRKFSGVIDIRIMYLGQLLESLGLAFFIFVNHHFVIAVAGFIIFTTGEILGSISKTPYLTKRIPETHRGRVLSITTSCAGLIGLFVMSLYSIYLRLDRKAYPGLYSK